MKFNVISAFAAVLCAMLTFVFTTQAQVVFEFTYADVKTNASHGFNDQTPFPGDSERTYGEVRRQNTEAAARRLGAILQHSVTVTVYVTSTQIPDNLGACGSPASGGNVPGFVRSVMAKKIIEGIDDNGDEPDAELSMNFMNTTDPEWGYDDNIGEDQYDFQDTLIHELTHALGYLNAIEPGGGGLLEDLAPFQPQKWYAWDAFLSDADGNHLVNRSTYIFNQDLLPTLTNGAMFFDGANAKQGNNGEMVQIYAPNPWSEGSSASHPNINYPAITTMFWIGSRGPGSRGYMPAELGMLADLGYNVVDLSGPANVAASTNLNDRVRITWQAPTYTSRALSNVVGYAVYRAPSPSAAGAVKLEDLNDDVFTYDDTTATENVNYYYWVRAKYDNIVPQTSLMRTSALGRHGQGGHDVDPDGPIIRANNQRTNVVVQYPDPITLTVTMIPPAQFAGAQADWWVLAVPADSSLWYYFDGYTWIDFPAGTHNFDLCRPAYQGPLVTISSPVTVLPATPLPRGVYRAYFGVDQRDDRINYPNMLLDHVTVTVQ